jgi:ankyrin repeat protein
MIKEDNEEEVSQFFDHGMDVNIFLNDKEDGTEEWTPMHYASKFGALNVIIALISRGAGVDPPDASSKTPLMVAIENSRTATTKSLIELGADIE